MAIIGTKNWNCDNDKCKEANGEVRVLPVTREPHGSQMILCYACFDYEITWRKDRNKELEAFARFDLPEWEDLKVYDNK